MFRAWAHVALHAVSVRYRCRKPVYEWRMWVVKLKARHHLFAKCFWPIYTWRKYTRATTLARQKSRFLVNTVRYFVKPCNIIHTIHTFVKFDAFWMGSSPKFDERSPNSIPYFY